MKENRARQVSYAEEFQRKCLCSTFKELEHNSPPLTWAVLSHLLTESAVWKGVLLPKVLGWSYSTVKKSDAPRLNQKVRLTSTGIRHVGSMCPQYDGMKWYFTSPNS